MLHYNIIIGQCDQNSAPYLSGNFHGDPLAHKLYWEFCIQYLLRGSSRNPTAGVTALGPRGHKLFFRSLFFRRPDRDLRPNAGPLLDNAVRGYFALRPFIRSTHQKISVLIL